MEAKRISLKERLLRYMQRRHNEFVASGDLQRLVVQYTDYTPRTAVRRLQELYEENVLEREIRKGHAFYRIKQKDAEQKERTIEDYIHIAEEQKRLFQVV